MPSFASIIIAALASLLFAGSASAGWTQSCRNSCIGAATPNILVTECLVSGGANGNPNDQNYEWAEFDLNQVLEYAVPFLVYQQDGDFATKGPCSACSVTSGKLKCVCGTGTVPTLDLDTWMSDATGVLCFANSAFGPTCGKATSSRC
ncbi:hypothetical protein Sste5346_004794 [Sporothrix stenoceras]|uniref:Cyanovirin-N domain-containing protein n=1 Tax=Sporothrix stenoceras TaxID=5173 RepID=A0ABR3Z7I7_9PEZI